MRCTRRSRSSLRKPDTAATAKPFPAQPRAMDGLRSGSSCWWRLGDALRTATAVAGRPGGSAQSGAVPGRTRAAADRLAASARCGRGAPHGTRRCWAGPHGSLPNRPQNRIERAPASLQQMQGKIRPLKRSVEQVQKATDQVEQATQVGAAKAVREVKVKATACCISSWPRAQDAAVGAFMMLVLLYFLMHPGDLFLRKVVRAFPSLRDKIRAVEIRLDHRARDRALLLDVQPDQPLRRRHRRGCHALPRHAQRAVVGAHVRCSTSSLTSDR